MPASFPNLIEGGETPVSRIFPGKQPWKFAVIVLVAALWVWTPTAAGKDQPLKADEIIGLLNDDVPSSRVAQLVKQLGVSFKLTSRIESDLRKAGATSEVIDAIKAAAPAAVPSGSAPPTGAAPSTGATGMLKIISKPGEAEVYVDDIPRGTTSPEGELRLPEPGGKYKVRVSLSGYETWENPVTLDPGETQAIYVTLTPRAQASQPPPSGAMAGARPALGEGANPNAQLDILPVPGAAVRELRFYTSGHEGLPLNQRQYSTQFSIQTTQYVNWELHLVYPKATQDYTFLLDAFWYAPNGEQAYHQSARVSVQAGWNGSRHAIGWGCTNPPCKQFVPGNYRVVVTYQGRELRQGMITMVP